MDTTCEKCGDCGQDYYYCQDCGGITEGCKKGCCYGPDGPSYLGDCACSHSAKPD